MPVSIDQQFVEFVVKSLVDHPDDVSIERTVKENGVVELQLTVNPEDLGRVIGKRGATAQSVRKLLYALGTKNQARYDFRIIDNGEPRETREGRAAETSAAPEDKETKPADSESQTTEATPSNAKPDKAPAETVEPASEPVESPPSDGEADDSTSLTEKTMKELEGLDDLEV